MSGKGINFFEEHVEKIVLAVVGLICLWLLVFRVLFSPNYVEYDRKKFSTNDIDNYLKEKVERLQDTLESKPKPAKAYKGRLDRPISPDDAARSGIRGNLERGFSGLMDSAISHIDVGLNPPQPAVFSAARIDGRAYDIPSVGGVDGVAVGYIRAAAYVPTEEINEEYTYEECKHEPNDIDFVTVEADFDIAGLFQRFDESFAGIGIPAEWRDLCLAKPIIGAVQLQRQELLSAGTWGQWEVVPRTKIDHRRKTFEVIERVDDLPLGRSGVKVRLLQFDDGQVMRDLLQPVAYRIASAEEEWFPPLLHEKYVKTLKEIALQERREAKAAERKEKEEKAREERSKRTAERKERSSTTDDSGMMGYLESLGGSSGSESRSSTRRSRSARERSTSGSTSSYGGDRDRDEDPMAERRRRREEREKEREKEREAAGKVSQTSKETTRTISTSDIYDEFKELLVSPENNLLKMDKLVFWAHDDTVEPKKSYRYRIRLGVLNPIGGTDLFSRSSIRFKNDVYLWSDYSDLTERVDVPARLYFFPYDVKEAAKAVSVKISRYVLGYWYSEDFTVRRGEAIGNIAEPKIAEGEDNIAVPATIDYSTGAVFVDAASVSDWLGSRALSRRDYFDMLYTFNGSTIERIPVKPKYWSADLLDKYRKIEKSEKEPKKPLRPWGGTIEERTWSSKPTEEQTQETGGVEDYMKKIMQMQRK